MTVTNLTIPVVSGTARSGQTLTTSTGTWDWDDVNFDISYSYQWYRCDSAGLNPVAIFNATNSSYTLTPSDIGSTIRSQITATEVPIAVDVNAHFISDWSSGLIGYQAGNPATPWTTIFSYTPPTYQDVGLYGDPAVSSSPDGRVAVVANPYGSGNVLRCELRDNDPYSSNNLAKAELGSIEERTCGGPFFDGLELWFSLELYIPDEFSFAYGGSNPFMTICDLHTSSGTGIPTLGLGGYSTSNIQLHAGRSGSIQRMDFIPVIPGNRNRKLDILIGAKLSSNGWVEAWLDGVNTVPRRNAIMIASDESGPYWKQGLYTYADSSFTGGSIAGRSVIYHGHTYIGKTKAEVGG